MDKRWEAGLRNGNLCPTVMKFEDLNCFRRCPPCTALMHYPLPSEVTSAISSNAGGGWWRCARPERRWPCWQYGCCSPAPPIACSICRPAAARFAGHRHVHRDGVSGSCRLNRIRRPVDWVKMAGIIEQHDPRFDEALITVTSRVLGSAEHRGSDEILSHLLRDVERRRQPSASQQDSHPALGRQALGGASWRHF